MDPHHLLRTLQLSDTLFPVGGFSWSDGLETAAAAGLVADANGLAAWAGHYLDAVFVPCDGLAAGRAHEATAARDWTTIERLEEEVTALRPASATRASSVSVGRRLLATCASVHPDLAIEPLRDLVARDPRRGNAAVVYGAVFALLGVRQRDMLLAFGYSRLAGIVSAGLRLLPVGQVQGQLVLSRVLIRVPEAVDAVAAAGAAPLRSFSPMLDVQQMNHQDLYSRLFRS